jgi:polysaccharide deacetylase family protein (PEP-CTERM system associated)
MNIVLTFDVEDYFQVENMRPFIDFADWDRHELRVGQNVGKVLKILDSHKARATFFVLGWIAERCPSLVRDIQRCGHEVACHGYAHRMICEQTPDEFTEDIRRAKAILEDTIDEEVMGYRAPTFSITQRTLWALDILAEEGFQYDSSIFPVRHDRYGFPAWSRNIRKVKLGGGNSIIEAPPLTVRMLGMNFPVAGGGYFRLLPLGVTSWAIRRMNAEGHPAILYLHPWELDSEQPRFSIPHLQRFRHYLNLSETESKLRHLLASGSVIRLRDILTFDVSPAPAEVEA